MVTLNMESVVETPKELWWAYSPDLGWVVQDRSLSMRWGSLAQGLAYKI